MKRNAELYADIRLNLELSLLSGMIADPTTIPHAFDALKPDAISDPANREVFCELHRAYTNGHPIDLSSIADELHRANRLQKAGGPAHLSDLWDGAATGAMVDNHARRLQRFSLEDQLADVRNELEGATEPDQIAATLKRLEEIEAGLRDPLQSSDFVKLGFCGNRLREVRERPAPESPLPGFLDSAPHLHLNQGKQKSGKTTLGLKLARDWVLGVSPWPGAPELPGTRALIVSREQPVARIDNTLRRLSVFSGCDRREEWTEKVVIIGRDPELSREGHALMTLDEGGLRALRAGLMGARKIGDPFGLVVLDSLSRLKPPGIEENDNDAMTEWLDKIEDIAVETETYIMLIHHVGHSDAPSRGEARSAARGSSAIGAVAQAAWLLERVSGSPRQRALKVDGNEVLPAEYTFEVCGEKAEPGSIHYFRPVDPLEHFDIDKLVDPGEEVNITTLAWRTKNEKPVKDKKPGGAASKAAGALFARWEKTGLGAVYDGPNNSRVFKRKECTG